MSEPVLSEFEPGRQTAERFRLSVLAPRSRLKTINSEFATELLSLSPITPTIEQVKSLPEDWASSSLVAMEVPMLELGKRDMHLSLHRQVARLQNANGPKVLLIVTPRAPGGSRGRHLSSAQRGQEHHDRPVRQWNRWPSSSFQLVQVCSCRYGDTRHQKYYVGTDLLGFQTEDCCEPADRPPGGYSTSVSGLQGLCGIIRYGSQVCASSCSPESSLTGGDDCVKPVAAPPTCARFTASAGNGASANTRLTTALEADANRRMSPEESDANRRMSPVGPGLKVQAFPTEAKERERKKESKSSKKLVKKSR